MANSQETKEFKNFFRDLDVVAFSEEDKSLNPPPAGGDDNQLQEEDLKNMEFEVVQPPPNRKMLD